MTAISICEIIFNDRLLAIQIANILCDENIGMDKILNIVKKHSDRILNCLDTYPKYFSDRLTLLLE